MRWWRLLFTVAVLLLLQTTVVPWLEVGGARPNLLLIFVVWRALRWPLEQSYLPCWLAGLARDIFSGGQVGAFAALYLALALGIDRVRRGLFVEHLLTQVLMVAAASLVSEGVWLLVWFHRPGLGWWPTLLRLLMGTLYTAVVTPLVLGLLWCLGWRRG